MKEETIKRMNRAIGIAEYVLEGHTLKEAGEEFGISPRTAKRDILRLAWEGYGSNFKQVENNQKIAQKAILELESRQSK